MTEEHSSPIKTPKQLIIVVLLGLRHSDRAGGARLATRDQWRQGRHEDDSKMLTRIQPVGKVVLAEPSGPQGHADR